MEEKVQIPCGVIENCTHIEIDIAYMKGEPWMNLYKRRGYYMNVRPVRIYPVEVIHNGLKQVIDMVSYGESGYGKTYFLEGTERKSPKRLKEFVEKMNRHAKEIAEAFVAKRYDEVWQYV